MKFIAIIFVALMPVLAHAETVEGMARVVDGDTIEVKDQKIRLWGIDAPEAAQRCTEDGAAYPCGLDASHALAKRIGRKPVTCVRRDTDRYGRMVALCTVEGVDISQWMVTRGQAIAFRKYSLDYIADEDRARAAKAGLWAGEFEDPSDFRHKKRGGQGSAPTEHATPQGQSSVRRTCACPDDTDGAGRRCGRRSSYLRLGGRAATCAARNELHE
jgi:endonuclease YncB( thermonuclease family)